jgi:hypothetical protein
MLVEISEKEAQAIMVGMNEFSNITTDKKRKKVFGSYEKISNELVEKFRKICWEYHYGKSC